MTFKPSLHGWGFEDAFEIEGPALGLGTVPARLGLGGGMCWAALDRYLDGRAVPGIQTTPEPGTALHAELRQRQVAALAGVWPRLRQWQRLPDASWRDRVAVPLTPGRGDVASLTRREWPVIRRSLKAGRPILLTLVEPEDGYARLGAIRQVLAFDCSKAGGLVTLSVYDPTSPGNDDVHLGFSLRGPLQARLSGGARVRGFFTVPYDRDAAAGLRAESFADRSVLGLNRKVYGVPQGAAGRRGLHLVARDEDGALLHFHRRNGRTWEGANVTEREELGAVELHSDPVVVTGPGGLGIHAFGRSYLGDLLHFRGQRRWRVANRTENRRAGPRFRLEGDPVPLALPWGALCVVGRGKDGALITYEHTPHKGWRADEIPGAGGGVIVGDPVAVRLGKDVHVAARGRNGHVLHFERTKGGWSAGDLTTLCAGTGAVPATGSPVLTLHGDGLHVLARAEGDRLLHMERDENGQWQSRVVGSGIGGDPAAVSGPGGLHVFAPGTEGGLLHAWWSGEKWRVEDLVATRRAISEGLAPDSELVAWGSEAELRLFGRRDGVLVQWVWRADSDWVAGPLGERLGVTPRHQPVEEPRIIGDRAGGFHLFGTDGTGTVVHLEPGEPRAAEGAGAAERVREPKPRRGDAKTRRGDAKPRRGDAKPRAAAAGTSANGIAETTAPPLAPDLTPAIERFPERPGLVEPPAQSRKGGNGKAPEQGDEKTGPAKREPTPASPELPLLDLEELDTPEPETVEDLPLLEADDDEPFEWENAPDAEPEAATEEEAEAEEDEPEFEPFDLESLENWPPTVDSAKKDKKKKKPAKKKAPAKKQPAPEPLPWPEEG